MIHGVATKRRHFDTLCCAAKSVLDFTICVGNDVLLFIKQHQAKRCVSSGRRHQKRTCKNIEFYVKIQES